MECISVAYAYDFAGDYTTAYEFLKTAEKMKHYEAEIDGVEIYTGAGDNCKNLKSIMEKLNNEQVGKFISQ